MDTSSDVMGVLSEIRDLQQEQLDQYLKYTSRALELQEAAVNRQAAIADLYRKVVLIGSIVMAGLIAFLFFYTTRMLP